MFSHIGFARISLGLIHLLHRSIDASPFVCFFFLANRAESTAVATTTRMERAGAARDMARHDRGGGGGQQTYLEECGIAGAEEEGWG